MVEDEEEEWEMSVQSMESVEDSAEECSQVGLYHYLLLVVCGMANASDAIEILSISYALPGILDTFHPSHTQNGFLTASVFLGLLLGGLVWGRLADQLGRRNCLLSALFINFTFALLSPFSPPLSSFSTVVCRRH